MIQQGVEARFFFISSLGAGPHFSVFSSLRANSDTHAVGDADYRQHAFSNSNIDTDANTKQHQHALSNPDANLNSNTNVNPDCFSNVHQYQHALANANTNAKLNPDSN